MPAGNEDLGEQIVQLLPRLRRFARSLANSVQDADDLVQLAIERALQALREFEIGGVPTTRDVLYEILGSDEFRSGDYSTSFIDDAGAKLPALAGA